MPMKTSRRRRSVTPDTCHFGGCRTEHHPDHHFLIDLRDGKPFVQIHACTAEHLRLLRVGFRRQVVPDA